MKNLENAAANAEEGAAAGGGGSQSQLKSAAVFDMMAKAAATQGPGLVKKVSGVY